MTAWRLGSRAPANHISPNPQVEFCPARRGGSGLDPAQFHLQIAKRSDLVALLIPVLSDFFGLAELKNRVLSCWHARIAQRIRRAHPDAKGNLFGTTGNGGANALATGFEIVKTASGYASAPTTLVSFCELANCADGAQPNGGLIADANGNLFGTTFGTPEATCGGCADSGGGTFFEITDSGFVPPQIRWRAGLPKLL